jgi:LuxR family quorum-sensing system transcriptional regulator SolR
MDLSKHSLVKNVNLVKEITNPMLKKLGLSYFNFIRNFNDDTRICLTTNSDWPKYFCEKKLYLLAPFERDKNEYDGYEFIFWPLLKDSIVYREAKNFNIKHSITIVRRGKYFIDFFHFGCHPQEETIYDRILHNRDFLSKFILQFKENAAKLIKKSDILKFPDLNSKKNATKKDLIIESSSGMLQQNSIDTSHLKKYYLGADFDDTYLTKKEFECLKWLVRGKSIFEIANLVNTSASTVETHVENIKLKVNCTKIAELCYKIAFSDIGDILREETNI